MKLELDFEYAVKLKYYLTYESFQLYQVAGATASPWYYSFKKIAVFLFMLYC